MGERMLTFQTLCTRLLQKREKNTPSTSSFIFLASIYPSRGCHSGSSTLSEGGTRAPSTSKWILGSEVIILDLKDSLKMGHTHSG